MVSDGVADGSRPDRGGPAVAERLGEAGFTVAPPVVVPDGVESVGERAARPGTRVHRAASSRPAAPGFGPRDLTPEGTRVVLDREAPGLAEAMRLVNPLGRLSRGIAGTIGTALVLNLPGSPKGAVECLDAVLDIVPHALDLLAGHRPH